MLEHDEELVPEAVELAASIDARSIANSWVARLGRRRAIAEPAEVQVAEIGQLGGTVVNLLYQGLVKGLADAGLVVVAQTPRPTIRPAKPMWASPSPGRKL